MCSSRDMNKADNVRGAKVTDALLNYETVKYFSNEVLERDNFGEAIQTYQVRMILLSTHLEASMKGLKKTSRAGLGSLFQTFIIQTWHISA